MPHYDTIVIGRRQLGALGVETELTVAVAALVEGHLGGTCVNTGCTPTKTTYACSRSATCATPADGVRASAVSVDLPKVVARKDRVVGQRPG